MDTDTALDFSFDGDDAPSVQITVPIRDDAGTFYATPREAARLLGVSTRAVERALRDGNRVAGMRFTFA